MHAREAKKIVENTPPHGLSYILHDIEMAAKSRKRFLTIREPLNVNLIRALEDLGYKVENHEVGFWAKFFETAIYHTISW